MTKQKIIEILKWYDLNDYEIDEITTPKDVIEYLEDAIYDYGDETCSFDVMIIENILRKLFAILLFDNYYSTYMPSIWVTCLVWIVGILIGCIVKKLPFIGKLI